MNYIYMFVVLVLTLMLYEYIEYKSIKREALKSHIGVNDYIRTTLDYSDSNYKYDLWDSK